MSRKDLAKRIALFCVILILVLVMIISGLQILKSTDFYSDQASGETQTQRTVVRNGKAYYPRQDITVMMILGIDQAGPVKDSGAYTNPGMADMVLLLIFDETNKKCSVLQLNRDTMLDVNVLGLRGDVAGTHFSQLALAHSYGSGMEDSCENVRNTLENFIPGLSIDYYIAMNLDAIPLLNDAVGGVEVNVVDDFSMVDPSIPMGKTVLRGQQVLSYVQDRKDVGDQKNETRMTRQREYMNGFLKQVAALEEDSTSFFMAEYEKISPYVVTDCSVNSLSGMVSRYKDYELVELVTPEGEAKVGEEYYEFYVDKEKLDELVLRLFYAEK